MKKLRAAFITFDFVMMLLLLLFLGQGKLEGNLEEAGITGNALEVVEEFAAGSHVADDIAIYKGDEDDKMIAITFDDGPHPSYTEVLLDGLLERGVKATFFVTGEHAKLHPDIIQRMSEEGHLIGNHTYSHMQLRSSNREEYKKELLMTNEVLEAITGEEVIFVRPPYGSWDKTFEKELNMIPVLWTVDPLDWCSGNADFIVQNVLSKAGENDIILMHDYFETSVEAALKIIDELLADGYTFVTVEEIIFE